MRKKGIIVSVLSVLLFLSGCTGNRELRQTFIANCGFFYESGPQKVLIDPFGTQYGGFFYLPSAETLNKIASGESPFDNVDLLLTTHIHGDHFDPFLTEKFMLNNQKAKMVCPPQVLKMLKDSCIHFNEFSTRIISPELQMTESKTIKLKDIPITIIRMQHGSPRDLTALETADYNEYEKTENFAYVIDFSGKKVFHQGDAFLRFNKQALKNIEGPLKIAYLSFFDWDSASYELVKNDLQAENIVFMHGTKPAEELEREEFKRVKSQVLFFEELETAIFK